MKKFFKALSENLVAVFLLIGVIAAVNWLAYSSPLRWDMTEEKEYTLSEATRTALTGLEDRLTFKLFYSKEIPPQLMPLKEDVSDMLAEIKAHAAKPISIEFADPDSNEMKEQETIMLGIQPLQVNIIEKDKRELKKIYMGMAIYYRDRKEVIPVLAQVENLEYALTLNLIKLTQKEMPRIGIVLPENQVQDKYQLIPEVIKQFATPVTLSYADKDLAKKNLKSLILVEPQDVSKEFSEELDNLLASGINVMVFAARVRISDNLAPGVVATGLDDWLTRKGVGISEKLLLDVRQNGQAAFQAGMMQLYVPYPFWVRALNKDFNTEHPITAQLEEVLMPWTNVIETRETKDNSWESLTLVSSSKSSFLQQDEMPSVSPQYLEEMTETPVPQSYPLSVILKKKSDPASGSVFLTSNFNFLQDNFLQQSPSNAVFFQNTIEYASWGTHLIGIRSRGKTSRPLVEMTDGERLALKWGHMIGMPFAAIAAGIILLWLGKNRRNALIAELVK